jgi:hypothetical protein
VEATKLQSQRPPQSLENFTEHMDKLDREKVTTGKMIHELEHAMGYGVCPHCWLVRTLNKQLELLLREDRQLESFLAGIDAKYDMAHKLNMYVHLGFEPIQEAGDSIKLRVRCPAKNDVFTIDLDAEKEIDVFAKANKMWEMAF